MQKGQLNYYVQGGSK